jgi:hypothetical protein
MLTLCSEVHFQSVLCYMFYDQHIVDARASLVKLLLFKQQHIDVSKSEPRNKFCVNFKGV